MAIVTTKEMFKKAYEGGYAIGAFNVNNMEIIQGITEAARRGKRPCDPAGVRGRAQLCQAHLPDEAGRGRRGRRPVCPSCCIWITATDFETCKSCIDGGFTSVMIDGSHHALRGKHCAHQARSWSMPMTTASSSRPSWARLAGVEDDVNVSAEDSSLHPSRRG